MVEALGLDLKTIIFAIVNFLVLMGILTKFLYRPFLDMLDRRKQSIKDAFDNAEMTNRKADEKLESGREAAGVYTMLSVLLFAAVTVELMTVVILSGDSLLLRQSFLMGCLIDLLAIMACTEGLHRLKIIETDGQ